MLHEHFIFVSINKTFNITGLGIVEQINKFQFLQKILKKPRCSTFHPFYILLTVAFTSIIDSYVELYKQLSPLIAIWKSRNFGTVLFWFHWSNKSASFGNPSIMRSYVEQTKKHIETLETRDLSIFYSLFSIMHFDHQQLTQPLINSFNRNWKKYYRLVCVSLISQITPVRSTNDNEI